MNFFCKLFGHTWVYHSENPKIAWHTSKKMNDLEMNTSATETRFWRECARCATKNDAPTREDIKNAT